MIICLYLGRKWIFWHILHKINLCMYMHRENEKWCCEREAKKAEGNKRMRNFWWCCCCCWYLECLLLHIQKPYSFPSFTRCRKIFHDKNDEKLQTPQKCLLLCFYVYFFTSALFIFHVYSAHYLFSTFTLGLSISNLYESYLRLNVTWVEIVMQKKICFFLS